MTIAVARNDSAEGSAALAHAAREAGFQAVPLAVLHVLDPEKGHEPDDGALRAEIQGVLDAAGQHDLQWTLHTAAEDTSRAASVIELAEQVGADLLVVGSRRRTPIGKFLLGSTVQRIVLDSPVPVLVVKAPPDGATPIG